MKIKRIIPCLDVDDGKVVKGIKFEGIKEIGDPVEFARRYSEDGAVYVDNMDRLLRKFATARHLVPAPLRHEGAEPAKAGVIYFGSTTPAMEEALDTFTRQGTQLDALRVRGFPFADTVYDFIARHDQVFVVEQNRDAQLRFLIVNEGNVDPSRLVSVLNYDGTPITARFIVDAISKRLVTANVMPFRKKAPAP